MPATTLAARIATLLGVAWGITACQPGKAAPIDDQDHPTAVATVRSMAEMPDSAHLRMTERQPASAEDSLRADELVVAIRDALEKYSAPKLAVRDGYRELADGDTVPRAIVHFFNWRYALEEAIRFNPAKPAALIYRRTGDKYRLTGALYTAPPGATDEELDARVPLSLAQWHQHVNWCLPKAEDAARWSEVGPDDKPVFGPESGIDTQEGCDAVAGVFRPHVFGWMIEARVFISDNPDSIWGWPVSAPAAPPAPVAVAVKPAPVKPAPDTVTKAPPPPPMVVPTPPKAPPVESPRVPTPPKRDNYEKGSVVVDSVTVGWERFAAVSKSHGPHPALILLHGAGGVPVEDAILREAAQKLAAHGYVVEILQYFDRTHTIVADITDTKNDFGPWLHAVGDAITQLRTAPDVDSTKIGLVGVNIGAALALHRAQYDKRVHAVVDYFGVFRMKDESKAATLPPVLIVGSEMGTFVPVREARRLDALLTKYNVPHETDVYPGSPAGLSPAESQQAAEHVIDFLRRYLPPD
jgi:dienelactone hydrolase